MNESLRTLVGGLIDYGGTFPPASLDLEAAVSHYAREQNGPHSWMLGSFVLPVARLGAFEDLVLSYLSGSQERWRISLVLSEDAEADMNLVYAFNDKWPSQSMQVVAVEVLPQGPAGIDRVGTYVPPSVEVNFEVPLHEETELRLAMVSGGGFSAKVRTGGARPNAFPSSEDLARFLIEVAAAEVPFKATAGLNHPLRCSRPLGAADASGPAVSMHGFLNVAIAAALVFTQGAQLGEATDALEEQSPRAFEFGANSIGWRGRTIALTDVAATRGRFFRSLTSCFFGDAVRELEELGVAR